MNQDDIHLVCTVVRSRVSNWKFSQATAVDGYAELPSDVREIIDALAACFSDCGWIVSNLGRVIACAVDSADRMLNNIQMGREVDSPDPS